ncbi:DUF6950 family protein [Ketogulonicigenium vulgare]|uniref:DUF6950 family protein n=1 Tax=Ketogulonicigenium vulgare TaxID=92945 RepID=UPI002358816F|nr:hypothetical protein [Ketogulonicigenium vulgare]
MQEYIQKIEDLIAAKEDLPFQYGQNDCTIFACEVIEAITGHNPALPYIGRYTTFLGGTRHLKADGYEDHVHFIKSFCHDDQIPKAFIEIGDLGLIIEDDALIWALVCGSFIIALTPKGLIRLSLDRLIEVYRVRPNDGEIQQST